MNKTIEEKAKAYDKAIEKIKYVMDRGVEPILNRADLQSIFPELKEREDEKIRKWLVNMIRHSWCEKYLPKGIKNEDVLAWLEKQFSHQKFRDSIQVGDKVTRSQDGVLVNLSQLQRVAKKGEPKPTEWSEEDETKYISLEDTLRDYLDYVSEDHSLTKYQKNSTKESVISLTNWLKSLRPQKQWDVKDDRMLCDVIAYAQAGIKFENTPQLEWLETLRDRVLPQNHWKPSEYELEALRKVANTATLGALYEQLKKL